MRVPQNWRRRSVIFGIGRLDGGRDGEPEHGEGAGEADCVDSPFHINVLNGRVSGLKSETCATKEEAGQAIRRIRIADTFLGAFSSTVAKGLGCKTTIAIRIFDFLQYPLKVGKVVRGQK